MIKPLDEVWFLEEKGMSINPKKWAALTCERINCIIAIRETPYLLIKSDKI